MYVKFGTPLINLWPQISLCEDAKLDPKIVERMDFSVSKMNIEFMEGDWKSGNATTQLNERIVDNPSAFPSTAKRFTVIAGNREIKKGVYIPYCRKTFAIIKSKKYETEISFFYIFILCFRIGSL